MASWHFDRIQGGEMSDRSARAINKLMATVEEVFDKLQNPAAPLACNDWHFWINASIGEFVADDTIPDITFTNTTLDGNTFFTGPVYFYDYFSIINKFPTLGVGIFSPIYLQACLIIAGEAPAAPGNAPLYSWGSSGTGAWESGVYIIAVTYVDDSGAESTISPETTTTAAIGGPSLSVTRNNSPPSGVVKWRVYVTPPDGTTGTETSQPVPAAAPTVFDADIGTATVVLPGPYQEGNPVPSAPTGTWGCFLPPVVSVEPTFTAKDGEVRIQVNDTVGGHRFPQWWVQVDDTAGVGTNWLSIAGTCQKGDIVVGDTDGEGRPFPVGTDGYVLTADSGQPNGVIWSAVAGTGTVTSVSGSGGTTGLTLTGGPITSSGTLTLGGTLVVASGGTGLATLTAHAVMLGEGTSNVGFATIGTAGRVLIDQGSGADPAFVALSGGATVNASGVVTLAGTGVKLASFSGTVSGSTPVSVGTLTGTNGIIGVIAIKNTNIAGDAVDLTATATDIFGTTQTNISVLPNTVFGVPQDFGLLKGSTLSASLAGAVTSIQLFVNATSGGTADYSLKVSYVN